MFANWKSWTVLNKKKNYRHNLHQLHIKINPVPPTFIFSIRNLFYHILHYFRTRIRNSVKKRNTCSSLNMVPKVFCFFVLPWRLLFHVFASKNRWVGFLPCFHPVNQVLKKWFRFEICSFFYLRYCPVFPPVFFTVIKKKTEILRQKRVISMNNLQQGKNKMENLWYKWWYILQIPV